MRAPVLLTVAFLGLTACVSQEQAIREEIAQANYCKTDAECAMVPGQCPFDCYVLANQSEQDRVSSLIMNYASNCRYSCVEPPPFSCVEGKCVFKSSETCESLTATFDELAPQDAFCGTLDMNEIQTMDPIWVGATLESVTKTKPEAGLENGRIEYKLRFTSPAHTKDVTVYSPDDIDLRTGQFHRFDYLNVCRAMLFLADSRAPSPLMDQFSMPGEVGCWGGAPK
jgi:hypothetical protein